MRLIRGDKLTLTQQTEVKQAYIYRLTTENSYPEHNPCNTRVAPISDAQWLREHAFYITNDGRLSCKHKHCKPACMAEED